jgi:hypothetical protein
MPYPDDTLAEMRRVARIGCTLVVTGLKKCFSRDAFVLLLETAGLRVLRLEDGCNLQCFVAVCQTLHLSNPMINRPNLI